LTRKEFLLSHQIYVTRKLWVELMNEQNGHKAYRVSRRKIGVIMAKYGLKSKYVLKRKREKNSNVVNKDYIENIVKRQFNDREPLEVVVSDLT